MRAAHASLLALCFLLTLLPNSATGKTLLCYTCVGMDPEDTCITDAGGVSNGQPISECEAENGDDDVCCSIVRQEYVEEEGSIVSFARSCLPKNCPKNGFDEYPDSTYRTFLTYCDTPKCNSGPGDKPLSGFSGGMNGEREIWGIKGLPDGAACLTASLTLLTCLPVLLHLLGSP